MSPVVKSVQEQWHIRTLTYRSADALVIMIGWWVASFCPAWSQTDSSYALAMTVTILVFQMVGEITGMYRNWRGVNVDKEVMCFVPDMADHVADLGYSCSFRRHGLD